MSRLILTGILLLGVTALPLAVNAQPVTPSRIGVVLQGGAYSPVVDGLRDGLREGGLEEGKQFVLHVREGKGDLKAVETAARRLEEEKVDVIYAVTSSVTLATTRATTRVPIVFYVGTNPVTLGLVKSYAKPGGRLTGIHSQFTDLAGKRLELLKEIIPGLRKVAIFYDPNNPSAQESAKIARDAARRLHLTLVERPVTSVEAMRAALRALRPGEVDALSYVSDAMVSSQSAFIADIAREKRLPTMLQFEEEARRSNGGLASYGVRFHTIGRLSARFVQRILAGAKPGELPVEQLDKFYFVVNRGTAKALGLTLPPSVLGRADEVVD